MPSFFGLKLPAVMGVININNQSFYQASRIHSLTIALNKIETMVDAGASIIDLGAQSTQPKALPIDEQTEWNLLKDILPELPKKFPKTIFSIDTFFANIAQRALDFGFQMINDVSAAQADPEMLNKIAPYRPFLVCMHWTEVAKNPQSLNQLYRENAAKPYATIMHPHKGRIVPIIQQFFQKIIPKIQRVGVQKILLDPGIGFGKTIEQNFEIIRNIRDFSNLAYPLLIGLSRKSFIYKTLNISPEQALNGSCALNMCALLNGASILRTHDVLYSMELIQLYQTLQGGNYGWKYVS